MVGPMYQPAAPFLAHISCWVGFCGPQLCCPGGNEDLIVIKGAMELDVDQYPMVDSGSTKEVEGSSGLR